MDRRFIFDGEGSDKYLRIASISVALYDYIITIPAEWRLYRSQQSVSRVSPACVLFILIRYVSILAMILSNYGVFSTGFTEETCQRYYLVAPVFKVMQTMVSQAILGVRTFNIARRDRQIGIALMVLYLASITLEWFTNMFDRTPVVVDGNCTPANTGEIISAWFYYPPAMLYDSIMLIISTIYLLRYNPVSNRLARLVQVLIYEGIGYFIILTGSNILNLILYRTGNIETQSAGVSIGYVVTWIMSQGILIHRREASKSDTRHLDNVVVARPAPHARKLMPPLPTHFDCKRQGGSINADLTPIPHSNGHNNDVELDIRVHVERSVVVNYMNDPAHSSPWG